MWYVWLKVEIKSKHQNHIKIHVTVFRYLSWKNMLSMRPSQLQNFPRRLVPPKGSASTSRAVGPIQATKCARSHLPMVPWLWTTVTWWTAVKIFERSSKISLPSNSKHCYFALRYMMNIDESSTQYGRKLKIWKQTSIISMMTRWVMASDFNQKLSLDLSKLGREYGDGALNAMLMF